MLDKVDVQETLKNNPSVDPKALAEALRIHKELSEAGLLGKRHRMPNVSRGKRITVGYPDKEDPRLRKLRPR